MERNQVALLIKQHVQACYITVSYKDFWIASDDIQIQVPDHAGTAVAASDTEDRVHLFVREHLVDPGCSFFACARHIAGVILGQIVSLFYLKAHLLQHADTLYLAFRADW